MTAVAIAAPNEAAADAGERVVQAGGNAVDAAIAACLVTMVNEVGIVSLSSGGFLTVQAPGDAVAHTVDGWMDMAGREAAARSSEREPGPRHRATAEEVRKALDPRTAMLVFVLATGTGALSGQVLVATADGLDAVPIEVDPEEIETAVDRLLSTIEREDGLEAAGAARLYEMLLAAAVDSRRSSPCAVRSNEKGVRWVGS